MIKATKTYEDDQYVSFRVEGIINNSSSGCIEDIWNEYINNRRKKVFLDLYGVSFIGDNFLNSIKKINKENLVIINCSPFIRELLEIKSSQGSLT